MMLRLVSGAMAFALALSACSDARSPDSANVPASAAPTETLPPAVDGELDLSSVNFVVGAGDAMWATRTAEAKVSAFDPESLAIGETIRLRGAPDFVTTGFGSLWVLSSSTGHLWRIDPDAAEIVGTGKLPEGLRGLATGLGYLWVTAYDDGRLLRVDPRTMQVTGEAPVEQPSDVVVFRNARWVASERGRVVEVDPRPVSVADAIEAEGAHALAAGFGSVWVSSGDSGDTVSRIDPRRGEVVATIETPAGGVPDRMVPALGRMWVGQYDGTEMLGIAPSTNDIAEKLPTGLGAAVVTHAFGRLWAANSIDETIWRYRAD